MDNYSFYSRNFEIALVLMIQSANNDFCHLSIKNVIFKKVTRNCRTAGTRNILFKLQFGSELVF